MSGRYPATWDDLTPDEELVGWTQRGQREAFGILYDRYLVKVYGYCFRFLKEQEAARDANSIVFTRALAALPTFRVEAPPGSFRKWLFTIAHNVIIDEARGRRATAPLTEATWLIDQAPSPEQSAIDTEDQRTLHDLMLQLSVDQRHVIALRLAGLSAAEIGVVLGRPRNAIDGIQHRALLKLKELATSHPAMATAHGGIGRE